MTDPAPAWNALNARHLMAGVKWVRAKLEILAASQESPPRPPRRSRRRMPGFCGWLFGYTDYSVAPADPVPDESIDWSPEEHRAHHEMGEIEAEMLEADLAPPALPALGEQLRLTLFESHVLLLCAAAELNFRIDPLCGRAQGDTRRPFPTLNLALTLFAHTPEDWQVLAPGGRLRRWMLVDVIQPTGSTLLSAALRIDPRALEYVQGLRLLDARLLSVGALLPGHVEALPRSQEWAADQVRHYWQGTAAALPVVRVTGPDRDGMVAVVRRAALRRQVFILPAERLPSAAPDVDLLVRLWERERRLFALTLCVEGRNAEPAALGRFVGRVGGQVAVTGRDAGPLNGRDEVFVDVPRPTVAEQAALWKAALGFHDSTYSGRLAAQFSLDESAIQKAAAAVLAGHERDKRHEPEEVFTRAWDECRARTRPAVHGLAQRIVPVAHKGDLVLSSDAQGQLDELIAQVDGRWRVYDQWHLRERTNRGLGISALFVGESGTGKTTAAEVVAAALRLDLYRIDLSAVVNKYIGETEKNLRRVFDAFEDGGAVLFFDEADALFGKRTEVKDSHDRYANIEVSYLLQRLEEYRGLAVLATNNRGAIDPAFRRRLRFLITFPPPDAQQREKLWEQMFHPLKRQGIPTEDLDYAWLARFDKLTGGTIYSAALHAAFLAAQRNHVRVTMPDVLDAIQAEYVKLNQPLRPAELALPARYEAMAV